jgi:hypothetical protein
VNTELVVNKFIDVLRPQNSLSRPYETAIGPHPEPDEFSRHSQNPIF